MGMKYWKKKNALAHWLAIWKVKNNKFAFQKLSEIKATHFNEGKSYLHFQGFT